MSLYSVKTIDAIGPLSTVHNEIIKNTHDAHVYILCWLPPERKSTKQSK